MAGVGRRRSHARVGRTLSPTLSRLATVAAIAVFVLIIIVNSDRFVELLSPSPVYARFGVDEHRSVMRLLRADVAVRRLDEDDSGTAAIAMMTETVGVFVVVESPALLRRLLATSDSDWPLQCLPAYNYHIYVVCGAKSDRTSSTADDDADDGALLDAARRLRQRCVVARPASINSWTVRVRAHGDPNGSVWPAPAVVADLVTEAYVDNVTWYDVTFARQLTLPVRRRWPPAPAERLPSSLLGVTVDASDDSVRVSFHKTHLDAVGECWPHWIATAADVAMYMAGIYSGEQLASRPQPDTELGRAMRDDQLWVQRYANVTKSSRDSCPRCQSTEERKVISMSLYGDDPRYTVGALRNAQRLPLVFPGWTLRFYCRRDPSDARRVLPQLLDRLSELGAEIVDVADLGGDVAALSAMLWRFTALDDAAVDVLLSRDVDSRLTDRDAAAVDAWLAASGRPAFHCIRDHPSHAEFPVNGGLWGARRRRLLPLLGTNAVTPALRGYGLAYMEDMRYLNNHVWTALRDRHESDIYCHDSVSCRRWPGAHPFTTSRRWAGEHIGQVFDAWSQPRRGDVQLLVDAQPVTFCEP